MAKRETNPKIVPTGQMAVQNPHVATQGNVMAQTYVHAMKRRIVALKIPEQYIEQMKAIIIIALDVVFQDVVIVQVKLFSIANPV